MFGKFVIGYVNLLCIMGIVTSALNCLIGYEVIGSLALNAICVLALYKLWEVIITDGKAAKHRVVS